MADDFEARIAGVEASIDVMARGLARVREAAEAAEGLRWPARLIFRWRARRMLQRGETLLLRFRATRDWLMDNEQQIREAAVRRRVWGA